MNTRQLLMSFVATHNNGVKTGHFDTMYQLLSDDAEIQLETVHSTRLSGKDNISQAIESNRPTDQLVVTGLREEGDAISALYGWLGRSVRISGTLHLESESGRVKKLIAEVN